MVIIALVICTRLKFFLLSQAHKTLDKNYNIMLYYLRVATLVHDYSDGHLKIMHRRYFKETTDLMKLENQKSSQNCKVESTDENDAPFSSVSEEVEMCLGDCLMLGSFIDDTRTM